MTYPVRKRNRLRDFDYSSANMYFITICTQQKRCILWSRAPYGIAGHCADEGSRHQSCRVSAVAKELP